VIGCIDGDQGPGLGRGLFAGQNSTENSVTLARLAPWDIWH